MTKANKPVISVDTRDFSVSRPHPSVARPTAPSSRANHDAPTLWPYGIALFALIVLIAVSARPRARATRAR